MISNTTDHLEYFLRDYDKYSKLITSRSSINDKLIACTQTFLDRPYQFDPLGDGENADIDKRSSINTKEFDCFSFCNIALALANSDNAQKALENLKIIRYGTQTSLYFNRFHFVELQWNQANQKAGFIRNITDSVFDAPEITHFSISINLPIWLSYQKKYLAQKFSKVSFSKIPHFYDHPVDIDIDYVSLNILLCPSFSLSDKIPAGSICQLVCRNWNIASKIGTQIAICHLGFITRENETLYFNQAKINHHIVKTPLLQYLQHVKKHCPHIDGIRLVEIQNQSTSLKDL